MNATHSTSTARILWLSWCGLWSVLWAIGAFVQFGLNPIFDFMCVASAAAMLIPVGSAPKQANGGYTQLPDGTWRKLDADVPRQRPDGTWTLR